MSDVPFAGARVDAYLASQRRLVERALARCVPAGPSRLRRAMRYSLLGGGKRIRPVLALAAGEIAGAPRTAVLPFACGLEMIHTYSLVHDDLPAMDDDDLRRGRPASHKVFGEGLAILVGDALLTEAFAIMAGVRAVPAARVLRAIAAVARAAGATGMVGGQALDLTAERSRPTLAQVRAIHRRKTGALLAASVRVGALLGDAPPAVARRIAQFGEHLGLAFQIADDILDAAGGPAADGRTDRTLGKATYPGALGLEAARRSLVRECDTALATLRTLGPPAEPLRAVTRLVAARAA